MSSKSVAPLCAPEPKQCSELVAPLKAPSNSAVISSIPKPKSAWAEANETLQMTGGPMQTPMGVADSVAAHDAQKLGVWQSGPGSDAARKTSARARGVVAAETTARGDKYAAKAERYRKAGANPDAVEKLERRAAGAHKQASTETSMANAERKAANTPGSKVGDTMSKGLDVLGAAADGVSVAEGIGKLNSHDGLERWEGAMDVVSGGSGLLSTALDYTAPHLAMTPIVGAVAGGVGLGTTVQKFGEKGAKHHDVFGDRKSGSDWSSEADSFAGVGARSVAAAATKVAAAPSGLALAATESVADAICTYTGQDLPNANLRAPQNKQEADMERQAKTRPYSPAAWKKKPSLWGELTNWTDEPQSGVISDRPGTLTVDSPNCRIELHDPQCDSIDNDCNGATDVAMANLACHPNYDSKVDGPLLKEHGLDPAGNYL